MSYIPIPENERCDEPAMLALTGNDLQVDDGYLPPTDPAMQEDLLARFLP